MGPAGRDFTTLETFQPQECEDADNVQNITFLGKTAAVKWSVLASFYNFIMSAVTFCDSNVQIISKVDTDKHLR